jgi:hypothetical protein
LKLGGRLHRSETGVKPRMAGIALIGHYLLRDRD